ncbi:MAG: tRNA (adenosine(37)-N6)-threonylcarbamoyltransferase complex transferase subunit TsaD [Armatimonadetes bacterium]|nr:tRNA (adenosine(37)-N6)-threonylcarbamoyltransferase complex transferase subunit TsaD [Akkermansiaceae bacterium]
MEGWGVAVFLAIESSCDETAVAILRGEAGGRTEVLASEVASQIEEHRVHGGVVPEVASRSHSLCLSGLVEQALATAGLRIAAVEVFGATMGPGLASSLLVGSTAAKAMACVAGKPFVGVNHLEGHLLSPFMDRTRVPGHVGLIVSGGHTLLMEVAGAGAYNRLGGTRDDAAGEAFDKVGKMLGLPYPGGPEIERVARDGDPGAFDFPRSMMADGGLDFSFSGLKTAVLYTLQREGKVKVEDVAASFQAAVVEVLVAKTLRAAKQVGADLIGLSGGVSSNMVVRAAFAERCEQEGIELVVAERRVCADNAAMIAFAGLLRFFAGRVDGLDGDIDPNMRLG